MPDLELVIIVAVADNGVIGREGALPWRLPDDLKRFKALTLGHAVVMGRRTHESIGRPLPGRRNYVLTHQAGWTGEGVERVASLDEAEQRAREAGETTLFVIGGETVYRAALPRAHRLEVTRVHANVEGDARFPPFDASAWRVVNEEHHPADDRHAHAMTFVRYERVQP
ncbi:MAG: dihydrofolate reductase [Phycisphaeraceae bacterium]